jgi:hypothetical protein
LLIVSLVLPWNVDERYRGPAWTRISELSNLKARCPKAGIFSGYRWSDSEEGSVSKKIALRKKRQDLTTDERRITRIREPRTSPLINADGTDLKGAREA